ncbi:hypothetical protein AAK899_06380 [Erysipelotrichaceae bacterium 51-3]
MHVSIFFLASFSISFLRILKSSFFLKIYRFASRAFLSDSLEHNYVLCLSHLLILLRQFSAPDPHRPHSYLFIFTISVHATKESGKSPFFCRSLSIAAQIIATQTIPLQIKRSAGKSQRTKNKQPGTTANSRYKTKPECAQKTKNRGRQQATGTKQSLNVQSKRSKKNKSSREQQRTARTTTSKK